jgi:thiamine biosynthesis lipoprotein
MNEYRFNAMGCEVVVRGGRADEQREVEQLFRDRDRTFSRFIPGSELNRVNEASGRPILVSGLFADTLAVALQVARETDGLVDPTLGAALEAAGYTRDFSELIADPRPAGPACGPRPVGLIGRIVRVPEGAILDLNGVVKSLAVDDALALLSGDASVSAGGDLAARGPLTVTLPGGDAIELRKGALATSGRTKRAPRRRGPASPDRPSNGTAVPLGVDRGHRVRRDVRGRRRRGEGGLPARRGRPRMARHPRDPRPVRS